MRLDALVLVTTVMLSGCGTTEEPRRSGEAGTQPGETSWGPLAVEPPDNVSATALIEGATIRITDECVFMEEEQQRGRTDLAGMAGGPRDVNENTATITYEGSDGSVTIVNGDRVNISGGHAHFESFQELVASIE